MSLRSHIERQFGRPEGILGRLAGAVMAGRPSNRQRNRWAVGLLAIEPGMSVLEIGFGPGLALAEVAGRNGEGRIVGIDHSEEMLAMAERRNWLALRSGRMELRCGGLELLDAMGGRFDRILSVNVVQFWRSREAAFARLGQRLAPGGLMATVYQPRHKGASRADAGRMADEVTGHLLAAGLEDVRTQWLELEVPVAGVTGRLFTRTP